MADYSAARDLAGRLLLKNGFKATLKAQGEASHPVSGGTDPVTGLPIEAEQAKEGASRTVLALKTAVDRKLFETTTIENHDEMLLIEGRAEVGETWNGRSIISVKQVDPDNSGPIISKALVR